MVTKVHVMLHQGHAIIVLYYVASDVAMAVKLFLQTGYWLISIRKFLGNYVALFPVDFNE